ncbi:major facilitator superfamily transporter [Colletotrichum graminicola]|uniref:Major facilitator superfamily transporter n=1 Tax=Colletotrichum graminicola (strain M1.001 / M2 / FGSC 10212) TaxID=645133 RepID=E3QJH4_COLGM|nr:major facilitator superfamily transporter [Colletotrichum graminicola M1.001]EFQ31012.1 major facilitator superfamily transporter [Colletotrichum graminicola M1.001]WDK17265.1 major facilitator superfamily transporter [Colletotrichum graminicola]
MAQIIREAPVGQLIRFVTRNKFLQYPEERPDFQLPQPWLDVLNSEKEGLAVEDADLASPRSSQSTRINEEKTLSRKEVEDASPYGVSLQRTRSRQESVSYTQDRLEIDEIHEIQKMQSIPIVPKKTKDGAILVDWYFSDDVDNPQNWSNAKRGLITVIICIYTFVVYMSSAIYMPSIEGVIHEFGVDMTEASLGLALFVLGYGIGPLLFSPLSEIPRIGRNPIYIVTMLLFVIVSIPAPLVDNYPGLMVLRFLQGLFGSPCLASGAASLGDMYSLLNLPYALIAWVSAAYCGPAISPVLSGFSVPAMGWRWSLWEVLWASAPVFLVMFLFLPETSTPNILLRRAERLRKLTGSNRFMSQSEIDQRNLKTSAVVIDALIKPLEITIKDPAILFVQVYTAIIYGIYYSFFEVFPLVYPVYYGMSIGQVGLVFLCILVACLIGVGMYISYLAFYMIPRIKKYGFPAQENRLVPALPASFGPTIGLFIFAWTASPAIHWIAPTIGITVYGATVFIVMQCIFVYVPLSYPQYAASLFAGNDFFRSAFAFASILFARPMYLNMGVARGTSLLGGLSTIGIIGIWLLYFYGARLRSLSKFAVSSE